MFQTIVRFRKYIAVPLALAMFFVSCEKDKVFVTQQIPVSQQSQILNNLKTVKYDGETLFKGIFFAEGPVASLLPEIKDFNVRNFITDINQISQVVDFQNQVITKISSDHPSFFNDFKSAIQTGNHMKIKNKLIESSNLIVEVVNEMAGVAINNSTLNQANQVIQQMTSGLTQKQLKDPKAVKQAIDNFLNDNPGSGHGEEILVLPIVLVAVIAVVIVAVIAVVLAVVITVKNFERVGPGGTPTLSKDPLLNEQLINSIAVNLVLKQ